MTIMQYCRFSGWSAKILVLALFVSTATQRARGQSEPPQFYAKFSDGTYLDREEIHGWHDANATPRIGRQPLFAAENPVEWIVRDRLEPLRAPKAFVEFVGGDRLPGVVRGYVPSDGAMLRDLPRHLVVEPIAAYRRPNSERTLPIRVELAHVRRIVWRNRAGHGPAPPGSAIRRDGSRINFRAIRWTTDALIFLTESDIVTVPWHNLAEVSLPAHDSWDAYFDHTATLLPGGQGQLVQMETDSGLIAQVSTQRLRPETQGDNRYTEHWYQIIQPAWSLDPLWIRFPDIRVWRIFPPEQMPLSLITPRIVRDEPIFSDGIVPRTNQTIAGENLADIAAQFGWGFAMHAPSKLIFPLSAEVIGFESHFGLDPHVGEGGCAEARIELHAGEKTSVLFESETLVGSVAAQSTGRLEIPKHSGGILHLIADPRIGNRPPGADPFDIRDALNWYAPTLTLDKQAVRDEIRSRSLGRIAPLADWEHFGESMGAARVTTSWSTRDWDQPRFRSWVSVEKGCLGLRRELMVPDDGRYLAVLAHAPESANDSPTRIQARVNGTPIAELTVPVIKGRQEVAPLLFPIGRFAGQSVTMELFQIATDDPSEEPVGIEWIGISVVPERSPVLLESNDPLAFGPLLERAAPGFTCWGDSIHLALLETHANRAAVLRTRTTGTNGATACEFTRVLEVPATSSHLRGAVLASNTLKTVATLRVLVNGESRYEQKLASSEAEKWLEFNVDLQEHAGETVCLQLNMHAPDQPEMELYWHDVRVE